MRDHVLLTPATCDCEGRAGCPVCDGGLSVCTVCGAYEGGLATECPGVHQTADQSDAVYANRLDYYEGGWRELTAARLLQTRRLVERVLRILGDRSRAAQGLRVCECADKGCAHVKALSDLAYNSTTLALGEARWAGVYTLWRCVGKARQGLRSALRARRSNVTLLVFA